MWSYRMCLVRLSKEGDDGKSISKSMSAILWQDMKDRMRMLAPMTPKVARNSRKTLDNQFVIDVLSYDEVCTNRITLFSC